MGGRSKGKGGGKEIGRDMVHSTNNMHTLPAHSLKHLSTEVSLMGLYGLHA